MKNRYKFLLAIVWLCSAIPMARAQEATMPQLSPISPEAAQYMRYGEIPVSLSTGVPDISIPIYTIDANGLQIPISISYHASGNRVKDVSGIVGLGWSLNAGGMIVQSIKGVDDMSNPMQPYMPSFFYKTPEKVYEEIYKDRMDQPGEARGNIIHDTFNQFLRGHTPFLNTMSDRFSYNFNGHVGTFRWEISGANPRLVSVPHSDLKIEFVPSVFEGEGAHFRITDTEGIVWTFRYGGTTSYAQRNTSREYYLASIGFPDCEDEVLFTYGDNEAYGFYNFTERVYYGSFGATAGKTWNYAQNEEQGMKNRHKRYFYDGYQHTRASFLKKITWKDLEIDLTYDSNTQDAVMKTRLAGITISHEASDRTIHVTLDNTSYPGTEAGAKRKLLSSIDVNGDRYRFGYNTDVPLPTYIPVPSDGNKYLAYEDF